MISAKVAKLVMKSQQVKINYNLEQFASNSLGYFLSRRVDGEYQVAIVYEHQLTQFFEALE